MPYRMDRQKLESKIAQTMPNLSKDAVQSYAERLLESTSEELMPNLAEWVGGHPLSDIRVGPYSLGMVMQIQGRGDFLTALESLNRYTADPVVGERMIWRTTK